MTLKHIDISAENVINNFACSKNEARFRYNSYEWIDIFVRIILVKVFLYVCGLLFCEIDDMMIEFIKAIKIN